MINLALIGIGTGNPEHLTLQAIRAIGEAGLVLLPRKGAEKTDLADLRRAICATHAKAAQVVEFDLPARDPATPGYLERVNEWHDAIAALWGALLAQHLPLGGSAALLIWGDPSLYDSSLRIAERLTAAGVDLRVSVIPGLTSLQLLTARHAIPLNTLGGAVQITTGRALRDQGWPVGVATLVVMLDEGTSFLTLPPEGITIWWGAYLGMPQEITDWGPLAEAGPRIAARRAGARAAQGWIMDICLLRRED